MPIEAYAIFLLAIAFIFNAFNAVYYYTIYSIAVGLLIILGCAGLLAYYESARDRTARMRNPRSHAIYKHAIAAAAFAEIIVMVPNLSFQNVAALYINPQLATFACLAIIIAPLMAYAIKVSQSNIGMLKREPLSYLYIVSALFGFLGLYSLAFYSGSAYLNSQAFISTVLFMNEGILFALVSMALLFS
ncbi:hypothetical protein Micr_00450 [Candidatus Micrarchaeum sp.]|nr:hypothetical protein Micr_00450 [Candidatus Micrarchaeum sp.]